MSKRLVGLLALGVFSAALTVFSLVLLIRLNPISPGAESNKAFPNPSEAATCTKTHSAQLFGYELCLPDDWLLAEFGTYKTALALAEKEAPAAVTDAPITVTVLEGSQMTAANQLGTIRDQLAETDEERIQLDGEDATKITGLDGRVANAHVLISRGRYTYHLSLAGSRNPTKAEEQAFAALLSSWKWIPIASHIPVASQSGDLAVTLPTYEGLIRSPQTLTGQIRSFESSVSWRLLSATGAVVASGSGAASGGEAGQLNPFSTTMRFTPPTSRDPGFLEVYTSSARDGSEQNLVRVPVRY